MNHIPQNIFEFLSALSLIHWLFIILILILSWLLYLWRYLRLQLKFARNLKRKIYFLKTSAGKNFQVERDLLKEVKLFRIEDDIKDVTADLKILQKLEPKSVFIVGYDADYSEYEKLLSEARSKNIPVIIFAEQGEIQNAEHWKIFNGYIYCDVANTSNRLSIILLNILTII